MAAGLAAADTTSASVIAYDPTSGKVTSLTAPKASLSATFRSPDSYEYTSATQTRVHVAGFTEPGGAPWARKVDFDFNGRIVGDTDPAGLTTSAVYDSLDDPVLVTDPAGMRTSTFYDPEGRATDVYGPAAATLFDATDRPGVGNAARVPHARRGSARIGRRVLQRHRARGHPGGAGIGHRQGRQRLLQRLPGQPRPRSVRHPVVYTGRITWPVTGVYNLNLASAGGAQLWVDGTLIDDAWTALVVTY